MAKDKKERERKRVMVQHGGAKEQAAPKQKTVEPVKEETGSDKK